MNDAEGTSEKSHTLTVSIKVTLPNNKQTAVYWFNGNALNPISFIPAFSAGTNYYKKFKYLQRYRRRGERMKKG